MSLCEFRNACTAPLEGKYIRLQRLNPEQDYEELYDISHGTPEKLAIWNYLHFEFPYKQPFESVDLFKQFLIDLNENENWVTFVVVDKKSNRKIGQLSFLNIVPSHKRAEIGGVWYTPEFHGTYANTESALLLLFHLFENFGFRRAEWKLNADNIPSGKAAAKLGFTEEGVFRQHMLVNGVNRDTKWYSMLDSEWEEKKNALFERLSYTDEDKENIFKKNKKL
ncbi:hypothetical protein MFLAVUS_004422 [Mucor flavus]|uniref:N-acetyltransferase domain-containing protein n=1 Tax=Mucor flavus TaxID=439312 RepID=A0ABP9YVV1_9FUNG